MKTFMVRSILPKRNKLVIAFLKYFLPNSIDVQYFVQKISFRFPTPATRVNGNFYLPCTINFLIFIQFVTVSIQFVMKSIFSIVITVYEHLVSYD